PAVYRDLEAGRRGARLERQLAAYAQRFCAKNETTGFAGPINYGLVDGGSDGDVEVSWSGPRRLVGRRGHVASRVLRALGERIAFDDEVAPWLVLRPKSFQASPDRAAGAVGRLAGGADGRTCLRVLADRLGLSAGEATAAA